ncbi:uncharacterized protein LOC132707802 isoform X2 [Cylas formicarius]|uniref:uncharacterized protein LOC132707802 isoform X2 n=1 Tax=Cylas formicarius TaxID=197179 RepID=UPI002958B663|nr:uncharacterized protein LOC132707802 isoform X2 [Cylas formicarius]
MAVALEVPGPIIVIKDEPLDIIDLDEEKTPEEAIYEWHDKVRKELNKHIRPRSENELLENMAWYLEQLKFQGKDLQDPGTLQNVMVKHIKVIELSFKRLKARKSDSHYLDLMEEIMTRFCDVVVENASQKKKVVPKKEMKKIMARSCRRIKCLLYHCLLASQQRIQHVLIKMQIDPGSQPCRDIINHVYAHFLTRIKQEQTDEAFCRGYIIFQKWKMVRKPEEADTVDRCLYSLYGHLPKNVATHEIFRSVVKLVSTSIAGMTRDYFAYIRARERDLEKREMVLDTVFDDVADLDITKDFDWERPRGSDSDFNSAYKRWDAEIHAFSVGNTDGDDDVAIKEEVDDDDQPDDVVALSDDESARGGAVVKEKKAKEKLRRAAVTTEESMDSVSTTSSKAESSSEPSTMAEERLLASPDLTRDGDATRSLSACSFLDDAASMTSAKSSTTCECGKSRDFVETPPPPPPPPPSPPHTIKTDTPPCEQPVVAAPDVAEANETKEAQVDDDVAKESAAVPIAAKSLVNLAGGGENATAAAAAVLVVVDPTYFANQSTNTGECYDPATNYVIMKLVAAEEAGLKSRTATPPTAAKCTASTQTQTESSVEQTPGTPSSMFLNLLTPPSEEQATGGTSRRDNGAAVAERTYHSSGEEDLESVEINDNEHYKNASHYYSSFSPMINEEEIEAPASNQSYRMSGSPEPQEYAGAGETPSPYAAECVVSTSDYVDIVVDTKPLQLTDGPEEETTHPGSSNVPQEVCHVVASLLDATVRDEGTTDPDVGVARISVTPLENMSVEGGAASDWADDIWSGPVTKLNTNIVNPDKNFDLFDSGADDEAAATPAAPPSPSLYDDDVQSPAYEPLDSVEVASSFFPKKQLRSIHKVEPADPTGLKVKIKKVGQVEKNARGGVRGGATRGILKPTHVLGYRVNVLSFSKHNVAVNDDRLLRTDDVQVRLECNPKSIERWLNLTKMKRNDTKKKTTTSALRHGEMVRIDYKKEPVRDDAEDVPWPGGAHFTMIDSQLKRVAASPPDVKGTLAFERPDVADAWTREEAARTLVGLNLTLAASSESSPYLTAALSPMPSVDDDDSGFNVTVPEIPCSPPLSTEDDDDVKDVRVKVDYDDDYGGGESTRKRARADPAPAAASLESCRALIENFRGFTLNEDEDGPKVVELDTKLPLKKRKMMAAAAAATPTPPPETDFDEILMKDIERLVEESKHEISYPATPMLSIAEVQEHEKMPRPPFKTAAERKEIPPPPPPLAAYGADRSRIVTEQYNNHTYNNPTINYHMNGPFPFYQPCGPVAYIPLLPYGAAAFATDGAEREAAMPAPVPLPAPPPPSQPQPPPAKKPKRGRGRPRKHKATL